MPEKTVPDRALVEALQKGDRDAFRELMSRHKGGITSYLYRRVADRYWAEDLAQEVFLRAFRKIGTFKSQARFSTWLYRIAHNLSIDFLKRRKLEPRLKNMGGGETEGAPPFEVEAFGNDPGEEAVRRELREKVLETVQGLAKKYRDVFVLCTLQGLSYEEAAEVLDLSVKTVSSRLCRARKRFKARVEPFLDRIHA